MSPARVTVLGVGNTILSDEGVGVRCVEALERRAAWPQVHFIDGGTSTHELLGDLEDLDVLIIVDAVRSGGPPGRLARLDGDAVPAAFTTKVSPHQVGVADLLATLRLLGRAPRRVVLFGVEPGCLSLGLELSAPVAAALPRLCAAVAAELAALTATAA